MAITMTSAQIATFKANLERLVPYHDHELLNSLAKGLYTSSNYHYEHISGLQESVVVNKIQLYSRHNVQDECARLCANLPLPKLYQVQVSQEQIDTVEFSFFPKRKELRAEARAQFAQESKDNELRLKIHPEPKPLDTSSFPKISRSLVITCVADPAFAHGYEEPLRITVYGVAAGHVVEYLHSIYPELEVEVIILNPEVTAIMLALDPKMGARLANEHTKLKLGNDDTPITPNHVFLLPEVLLCPNINLNLKQRIIHYEERNYSRLMSLARRKDLNTILIQYNRPYHRIAKQLLCNTFSPCHDIVLVLSGPSLNESFERLLALKEAGARVIACDTALPFLEQQDFAPDIVVASDIGIYKIAGEGCTVGKPQCLIKPKLYERSALIFTARTHLRVVALFSGKRYLLYTKNLARRDIAQQDQAQTDLDLYGGSAGIMLSLALKQQAWRIYLMGLDTISVQNSYHAGVSSDVDSAIMGSPQVDEVECNDGKRRKALHSYSASRLYVEDFIAKHPQIEFINCSSIGAVIKGASRDFFNQVGTDGEDE